MASAAIDLETLAGWSPSFATRQDAGTIALDHVSVLEGGPIEEPTPDPTDEPTSDPTDEPTPDPPEDVTDDSTGGSNGDATGGDDAADATDGAADTADAGSDADDGLAATGTSAPTPGPAENARPVDPDAPPADP